MHINASQKLLQLAQKGVFQSTQDSHSHVLAADSPRTKQTTQPRECLKPHKPCLALALFPTFLPYPSSGSSTDKLGHIAACGQPQLSTVPILSAVSPSAEQA